MGILDNIISRTKSDLEYKAGSEISSRVSKKVGDILDKKKADASKCPKCKSPVPSGVKFCTSCGAKLIATCDKCSIDYPVGTKFCAQCGKSLK